jgi:hypothetical protein
MMGNGRPKARGKQNCLNRSENVSGAKPAICGPFYHLMDPGCRKFIFIIMFFCVQKDV